MAWTKILPSADRAKRIPRGFSSVTIYSFKFILNVDEDDIATTLRTSFRLLNPTFPLPPNTRPFPFPDPIKSDGGDRSRAPKPEICWRRCAMVDWSENVDGGRELRWNLETVSRKRGGRWTRGGKEQVIHVDSHGSRFLVEVSSFPFYLRRDTCTRLLVQINI